MFKTGRIINKTSLILIGIVSILYVYKYSAIYTGYSLITTLIYAAVFFGFFYFLDGISEKKFSTINKKFLSGIFIIITAASVLAVIIIPRFGQVGRLPAINDWINRLFIGEYPYSFPITPSAFPFLYFFSMPFYFLGNTGLLEPLGIALILLFILLYAKSNKEIIIKVSLLLVSPVLYYEIAVRGELFANMMLAILVIFIAEKYVEAGNINYKFIFISILFGAVLSTRSVVGIVYAIYIPYLFRYNIPKGIIFSIVILLMFVILLLPFIIWSPVLFNEVGPFAIQSKLSFLPTWNALMLLVIAVYLGWAAADIQEVFFASGVTLFSAVFLSMIYKIIDFGFTGAIVKDIFDLSYFVFCIPFLVLSIKEYKVERYLGKIYPEV